VEGYRGNLKQYGECRQRVGGGDIGLSVLLGALSEAIGGLKEKGRDNSRYKNWVGELG